jgi:hypothetical protein
MALAATTVHPRVGIPRDRDVTPNLARTRTGQVRWRRAPTNRGAKPSDVRPAPPHRTCPPSSAGLSAALKKRRSLVRSQRWTRALQQERAGITKATRQMQGAAPPNPLPRLTRTCIQSLAGQRTKRRRARPRPRPVASSWRGRPGRRHPARLPPWAIGAVGKAHFVLSEKITGSSPVWPTNAPALARQSHSDPVGLGAGRGFNSRTLQLCGACGRSSMAELQSSKLTTRVRFSSPAQAAPGRERRTPAPAVHVSATWTTRQPGGSLQQADRKVTPPDPSAAQNDLGSADGCALRFWPGRTQVRALHPERRGAPCGAVGEVVSPPAGEDGQQGPRPRGPPPWRGEAHAPQPRWTPKTYVPVAQRRGTAPKTRPVRVRIPPGTPCRRSSVGQSVSMVRRRSTVRLRAVALDAS